MKITEKQLQIMLRVLEGSINIFGSDEVFGVEGHIRRKIYNEIINQQSDNIIDTEDYGKMMRKKLAVKKAGKK